MVISLDFVIRITFSVVIVLINLGFFIPKFSYIILTLILKGLKLLIAQHPSVLRRCLMVFVLLTKECKSFSFGIICVFYFQYSGLI